LHQLRLITINWLNSASTLFATLFRCLFK